MADEPDDGFEPTMWWRVLYADGRLYPDTYENGEPHMMAGQPKSWCEVSDEEEAREALSSCPGGGKLQQLFRRRQYEWRDQT